MRILKNEFLRLWKTPSIHFSVATACFLVVIILNIESKEYLIYTSPSAYKEAYANLIGRDPKEAYALYEKRINEVADLSSQAFLDKVILEELNEESGYEYYLDTVTKNAEAMTSVSIFSDKESFAYRNAVKIAETYEKMKGKIKVEAGPSKGVELWSGNGITGIIILMVILMIVNELVLKDRENCQLNLLFTFVNGRAYHGFIKLVVCGISSFVISFIILGTALLASNDIFGIGDVLRSVQSVAGLKGCTIVTNVLGYIMIYTIMMSLAVTVTGVLIFMVASTVNNVVQVYLVVAGVLGIEVLLYCLVGDNSYLAFLKEFNIISFVNPARYLSVYENVSMFGYPVNRFIFVSGSMSVLIVCLVPVAAKAYALQKPVRGVKACKKEKAYKKHILRSVSVFGHETYKLFICGRTLWILLLFTMYEIVVFVPVKEYFENETAVYYKRYALKFEGEITNETIEAINEEREMFITIEEELREIIANCPTELVATVSIPYVDKLKPETGLGFLERKVKELKEKGGYILYDTGYRMLTFDRLAKRKEITMAIMSGIMLIISLSFLFAGDDRLKMDRVTSVLPKGRASLLIKKYLLGSLVALVIYSINYVPYFISILQVYGTQGLSFPAQSVSTLSDTIFERLGFTVGTTLSIILILKYIVLLLQMLILSVISKKVRSLSKTIVYCIVFFVGPLLILYILL